MKKEKLFLVVFLIIFIFFFQIYAQVQFTPHNIDSGYGYISAHVIDMDTDGDMDILAIAMDSDSIYWFENEGNQHFKIRFIPPPHIWAGYIVHAIDLDQDGDTDILSAGGGLTSDMEWFENDGNQNFSQHYFTIRTLGVTSIFAVDMDNDEDIDVLVSTEFYDPWLTDRTISWYENDGSENFSRHIITDSVYQARSVFAIDVDDDGDMDVISTDLGNLTWYENDGNEYFSTHPVTNTHLGVYSVYAVDLDDDDDVDMISATFKEIAWYENDGDENFTQHLITTEVINAKSVSAIDIEKDGDLDILVASSDDGKIVWYENDSNENFNPHIITKNSSGAFFAYSADVDIDGDIDFFSASSNYYNDGKLTWYENLLIVNIDDKTQYNSPKDFRLHQNYPNPFNPSTKIKFALPKPEEVIIEVYNTLGQRIEILLNKLMPAGNHNVEFNGDNLSSGVYLYRIQAGEFQDVKKMILIR